MEILIVSLVGLVVPLLQNFVNALWARVRRRSLQIRIGGLAIELDKVDPAQLVALLDSLGSEDRRLLEYTVQRDEAERELARYLPDNPREAKRLLNHQRLYARIAEERNVFGGTPQLTHRHLAKWVLIVERWPRLGAALTRNPSRMKMLEESSDSTVLQEEVGFVGERSARQLFEVIHEGVLLSPILERLVRFEAAVPALRVENANTPTREATNGDFDNQASSEVEVTS